MDSCMTQYYVGPVRRLLANPKTDSVCGDSPMWKAVRNGETETVSLLLDDMITLGRDHRDMVIFALRKFPDVARVLIKSSKFQMDDYFISIAIDMGNAEFVNLFLANPATKSLKYAIEHALYEKQWDIAKMLIADSRFQMDEDIIYAAASGGNIEIMKTLLSFIDAGGTSINITHVLGHAAYEGHIEIVKMLLERIPMSTDVELITHALGCAAYDGHIEIVKMLLVFPGISVKKGIECAIVRGHFEIASLLIATRVEISMHTLELILDGICNSLTGHSHIKLLTEILNAGADLHMYNNYAFRFALRNKKVETARLLFKYVRADVKLTPTIMSWENLVDKQTWHDALETAKKCVSCGILYSSLCEYTCFRI